MNRIRQNKTMTALIAILSAVLMVLTGSVVQDNVAPSGRIVGATYPKDSVSRAMLMIDRAHSAIHGGDSFAAHYIQTTPPTDIDDKSIIAFYTGNTDAGNTYYHATVSASSTAVATAYIYESPTITDDTGATLKVWNRRRVGSPGNSTVRDTSASPNGEGAATYFDIASAGNVTGGKEIGSIKLGADNVPRSVGGLARETQEWILKPDTLYAFVVNSDDATNNIHWIEVNWYEHTE